MVGEETTEITSTSPLASNSPSNYALPGLLAILTFSIFIRLIPPTTMGFHIWGSDSGEYYAIIQSMIQKGRVPVDYEGWGFAYPFFYGMEVLAASLHLLSGMEVLPVMVFVLPSLAAFLVLPAFFITRKIFFDLRVALAAALFISVSPSGVFTTSHPMPGGLADLLGLLVILLYLHLKPLQHKREHPHKQQRSQPMTGGGGGNGTDNPSETSGNDSEGKIYQEGFKEEPRFRYNQQTGYWILLFLSIGGLMATHHMSSYFIFITLGYYTFLREIFFKTNKGELKRDIPILYYFMVFIVVYWLILIEPFRERIVDDVFGISGWILGGLGILCMTLMFLFLNYRRRWDWHYSPHYPEIQFVQQMMLVMTIISAAIIMGIAFVGVPGTSVDIDSTFIILAIPLFVLIIVCAPGPGFARFYSKGLFIIAWLSAITLSMIVMAATDNKVLLPYRHTQYLLEPVLILSALGIVEIYRFLRNGDKFATKAMVTASIVLLSIGVGYSGYPPREIIANFQEGTVYEEMEGVYWIREYRDDFHGDIASDHRMSSIIFGMGEKGATWDSAYETIHADSYENASEEIHEQDIAGVFMDEEIELGVALLQWENALPISDEALSKFQEPPFIRLMDSGFVQIYIIATISS